uniref:Uncharacterized protein n=1 Tax=Cannabis sativa TaxID=3483 RepID=A0A803R373_CANSA
MIFCCCLKEKKPNKQTKHRHFGALEDDMLCHSLISLSINLFTPLLSFKLRHFLLILSTFSILWMLSLYSVHIYIRIFIE